MLEKEIDMDKEIALLLEEYGQESVKVLKREVKIKNLTASNKMLNSINYKVQGSKVMLSFSAVLNIVDRGRRKGKKRVSSRDILDWMRDKNIRPRANRKKGLGSSNFAIESHRNMKSSAFMISKAISDKGTIKRFAHKGAKIIKTVRTGSKALNELKKGLSEVLGKKVKQSFRQLKTLR